MQDYCLKELVGSMSEFNSRESLLEKPKHFEGYISWYRRNERIVKAGHGTIGTFSLGRL